MNQAVPVAVTRMPPLEIVPLEQCPEDVLIAADGSVMTGHRDGRIIRLQPGATDFDVIADTGGIPLGLEFLDTNHLVACDAQKGLLKIEIAS